jgi:hypothetical protein
MYSLLIHNKLNTKSVSCWSYYTDIITMYGQQNIKIIYIYSDI